MLPFLFNLMTLFLPPLTQDVSYFPPIESALDDPDGLLAIGGDLSAERLISAYEHGIFPWFGSGDPLLWWTPSERAVIQPQHFQASRSLRKYVRKTGYRVSLNHCFHQIISNCANLRGADQTWISPEMMKAYCELHDRGRAHSVEVWRDDQLVGGLYGVRVGALFCGESMYSLETNASKTALWAFSDHFHTHGGQLIDCQIMTQHLKSLGAIPMIRSDFITMLNQLKNRELTPTTFQPQWLS